MQHNFNKEIEIVLNKNESDKEIEIFWFSFKQIVLNFIKVYDIEIPINSWSNILNYYQSKKDYSNIKKYIHTFISYYCIYIFKYANSYHTSILWVNIKQWKKINDTYFDENYSYYINIYHLLIDVYRYILLNNIFNTDILNFFKNIDNNFKEEDINYLIDLSVKHNLKDIIIKLKKYKKN